MSARSRYANAVLAVLVTASLAASPGAAAEVNLLKDLTDVLMVLGQPCGTVIRALPQGKDDHMATCSDGNRYRIYLNAGGRVVAEKQARP